MKTLYTNHTQVITILAVTVSLTSWSKQQTNSGERSVRANGATSQTCLADCQSEDIVSKPAGSAQSTATASAADESSTGGATPTATLAANSSDTDSSTASSTGTVTSSSGPTTTGSGTAAANPTATATPKAWNVNNEELVTIYRYTSNDDHNHSYSKYGGGISGLKGPYKAYKLFKNKSTYLEKYCSVVALYDCKQTNTVDANKKSFFTSGVSSHYYQGTGTIYVGGRVYIPRSIEAISPFREGSIASAADILGLATLNSVFIGDLSSKIYDSEMTPAGRGRRELDVDHVYGWFAGRQSGYESLRRTLQSNTEYGGSSSQSSVLDCFLYAQNTVAGFIPSASWSIHGGVIADHLHLLGVNVSNSGPPSQDQSGSVRNRIVYNARLKQGAKILGELADYFN